MQNACTVRRSLLTMSDLSIYLYIRSVFTAVDKRTVGEESRCRQSSAFSNRWAFIILIFVSAIRLLKVFNCEHQRGQMSESGFGKILCSNWKWTKHKKYVAAKMVVFNVLLFRWWKNKLSSGVISVEKDNKANEWAKFVSTVIIKCFEWFNLIN